MPYEGKIHGEPITESVVGQYKDASAKVPQSSVQANIRAAVLNELFMDGVMVSAVERDVLESRAYAQIFGEVAQLEQVN